MEENGRFLRGCALAQADDILRAIRAAGDWSTLRAVTRAFSDEMLARTHKYPMIYTTLDWWTLCTGNSSAFAATNPFTIAKYSSTQPTPPAGTGYWTMWQYADSGTYPGDQDYFNGTYAMLQNLARNADS